MLKKNILIVDDDPTFVETLKNILTTFFSDKIEKVFIAASGEEAVEISEKNYLHIIFMDYNLPGIQGDEVVRLVTQNNRYVKVIAISFHTQFEYIEKMLYAGAKNYITKNDLDVPFLMKIFNEEPYSKSELYK